MIRGLVFDLDGTLIDSRTDIARAANHALARHGFPELPESTIALYVGDGARTLMARAAALAPEDPRLTPLHAEFLRYYTAHPVVSTRVIPGAARALEALFSRYPLAVCTNKPRVTTERVLALLDLERYFQVVVAGDDLAVRKPDPGPVLHIAERLGVPPRDLVVVGDGAQDVLAGRAAGAHTVGVRGGIQGDARLIDAGPDVLLDDLSELPELVRTSSW
ncbi:MAG: phosphoglycolate phosphatase [Pseudomonadota bacterium]|nr:MAG: phosphoglycolate phosphatase [Pseudomonadota bacterium]